MKIIFLKKENGKFSWRMRFIMIISLLSSIFMSFLILNQPVAKWQEAGEWQVKIYQKADHMMSNTAPWFMIHELKMVLSKQESSRVPWCLHVEDTEGNELLPGVTHLVIYYSEDLTVVEGFALNRKDQQVMPIDEFFSLSLYGSEFFTPQRKRYQNLLMFVKETVKVELNEEKGKNVWWEKDRPWWIIYESNEPPLKAKLEQE